MSMADNDELRARVRALKRENDHLREKCERMRRQLGGTQGALSRAQQRARDLEDQLAAIKIGGTDD